MSHKQIRSTFFSMLEQSGCLVGAPASYFDLLETPSRPEQGDIAFPCFQLSKTLRKNPSQIAKDICDQITTQTPFPSLIEKVEAQGPYVNAFVKCSELAMLLHSDLQSGLDPWIKDPERAKKSVIVEFSSPNIAKPFSIGHLRSTNLGACLARIISARGSEVIKINHLGDWGTQFGKMLCAYQMWGTESLGSDPLQTFLAWYVRFHQEEEKNPELSQQARDWFSKLEKGDAEAREKWQWFKDITMKEIELIYGRLGVSFDHYWGESYYIEYLPALFKKLESLKLLTHSQNADIIDLKNENLGVAVIKKSDESSLYITRDLAAAIYRHQHVPSEVKSFDEMYYVVGTPQTLHFQQLFKILKLMGYEWASKLEHIAFGHIGFGDQSMSTRKGNVVFLQTVLNEAKDRAKKIILEKNPDLENVETAAEAIGLGAVLFADLSARRIKDVHFSWEDILRFEGETGPYLQYSLVRIQSIFQKAKDIGFTFDSRSEKFEVLNTGEEKQVLLKLAAYPFTLEKAEAEREPFVLGSYLIELCQTLNRFYVQHRVLDEDVEIRNARLQLLNMSQTVLVHGLSLLGIPRLEKM